MGAFEGPAEVDYLGACRHGVPAELAVLDELAAGARELAALDASDLRAAMAVVAACADQHIGLADASIVVLAERHQTTSIATLDRRHFGVLRTPGGRPFDIMP